MASDTSRLQGGATKTPRYGSNVIQLPTVGQKINQTPPPTGKQQNQSETPPTQQNQGGGSSGNNTDPETDPALAAFLDDQITALRTLLGLTDTYLEQGKKSVNDSFNRGVERLNQGRARTLRDIGIKRQETSEDKKTTLGRLDDDLMRESKGIGRMFNRMGSGISGAAQLLAPELLGNEYSEKRGDVFTTFGRNERKLKLAEDDTNAQHQRGVGDLELQKSDSLRNLESGIGEQRISLNEALREAAYNRVKALGGGASEARTAMAPYSNSVAEIRNALLSLFDRYRSPALEPKDINVTIPGLEGYEIDPETGDLVLTGTAGDDDIASLFPFLKREEEYAV